MRPLGETVATLKAVSIFSETADDVLAELVGLLEPVAVGAGDVVFRKGDLGTSLYVVVDGRVRVHDGDRTVTILGRQDVFGEMAALDPEPRSATVTALVDTRLLRLDRTPLFHLMDSRPEVARGIIQILCRRLRGNMRELVEDYTYIRQFALVTAAAAAVESGDYTADSLDPVAARTDALGQLARVFQRMAREISSREDRLKRQVERLRIEVDRTKAEHQVGEIVESEFFKHLQARAEQLRRGGSTLGSGAARTNRPDFDAAKRYALERLRRDLPSTLRYHRVAHTVDEAAVAVDVLAAMEGVQGEDLILLRTAALYHDVGFVEQPQNHEEIGVGIASTILPRFGYSPAQIAVIAGIIRATKLPQSPRTLLEMIMADADLDVLGRDDFFARNEDLRQELRAYGPTRTDEEWYQSQIAFMESHRYFTAAARALRADKKQQNILELERRLDDVRKRGRPAV